MKPSFAGWVTDEAGFHARPTSDPDRAAALDLRDLPRNRPVASRRVDCAAGQQKRAGDQWTEDDLPSRIEETMGTRSGAKGNEPTALTSIDKRRQRWRETSTRPRPSVFAMRYRQLAQAMETHRPCQTKSDRLQPASVWRDKTEFRVRIRP
jgi:hypothetical protein